MSRNAKLGLFAIAAILVFSFLSYKMGTFEFGRKTYLLEIAFDSVGGVGVGAPVRMAGVNIGVVEKIELERNDAGKTRAIVTARLDWDARVSEDAMATVRMVGFLGDSVLEISTTSGALIKRDPHTALHRIQGNPPFEIQRIAQRLEDSFEKLTPIIDNANAIIGSATTRDALENILTSVSNFTSNLSANDPEQVSRILAKTEQAVDRFGEVASYHIGIASDVRQLIRDNRQQIRSSIEELELTLRSFREHEQEAAPTVVLAASRAADAMERMDRTLERLEVLLARNEQNVDGVLTEASATALLAHKTTSDISVIVGDLKDGKGTLGRFLRDDDLADDITDGISETRDAIRRFTNPLADVHLEYELRWYEDDDRSWSDSDSAWRNDLALYFPVGDTWFMKAGANDVGADTGLELQFGGRWKRLTGRLGVLESEASIGADYDIWPERLTISADYIGLSDEEHEHLDSSLSVHLPWDFDVILGVDDLIDDQHFNAGIRKTF